MKKIRFALVGLLAWFSLGAMAADSTEYYTQYNIWIFKGDHSSLNYAVDSLVPVNSKVTIKKESDKKMQLSLVGSDTTFEVMLAKKYAQKTMAETKARLLGSAPVNLAKFSKTAQDAIKSGDIRTGMTRQEVLVARGYPPEHATLSLDSDQWKYWQNKWNTLIVQFNNGKVESIRD